MWRFLRNRRLILRLHTIFRALIHWAHHAVIFAIAWLLVDTFLKPCAVTLPAGDALTHAVSN